MLAGKMKLNHFLAIAGLVGVAGIVGAYFACRGGDDDGKTMKSTKADVDRERERVRERDDRLANRQSNTKPDEPRPLADTPPPVDDTKPIDDEPPPVNDNLRDVDRELMSWVGKDLGSKKKKDARKGKGWKINLYQDDGNSSMNRAKVDLDRDDRWDEKWTFDGKNISRKVAPDDDENYTDEYDWDGSAWVER